MSACAAWDSRDDGKTESHSGGKGYNMRVVVVVVADVFVPALIVASLLANDECRGSNLSAAPGGETDRPEVQAAAKTSRKT